METIQYIFFLLLFFSCQEKQPDYLEQALQQAGENRSELEKVLAHYQNDELKYQAAVFLIENMPGHYSYRFPEYLDKYYDAIAAAVHVENERDANAHNMQEIFYRYAGGQMNEDVWDIHIITADYLIDNIDRAFDVWQNGEWATHVAFDDFCELILPYKVSELQTLDNWREYAKNLLTGDLEQLHLADVYKNSAYWAVTAINTELIALNSQELPFGGVQAAPILRIDALSGIPMGTCGDFSVLAMAIMRSNGIPVTEDFTPQWSFQPAGHGWNVLLNNKGKFIAFSAGSNNPNELHKPEERMAKVFRRTYTINREIQQLNQTEIYVPPIFKNHFMRDVTDEYMSTSDVEIVIPDSLKNNYQYAYLAVFDNQNWIPTHYGKVANGKVKFEKMGKNSMYLPVFFDERGVIPFDAPFFIHFQGEIIHCEKADQVQDMTLRRKYFIGKHCYDVGDRLKGGKFQVANRADFRDSITIYQIPTHTTQSGELFVPEETGKFRYWRYLSAFQQWNNMAEMYFYQKGNPQPIYGKIIGTLGSCMNDKQYEKEVVFDGDPLTFYDAAEHTGSWVGLDFGEPITIDKISYTPRGDGNDVTPGDLHELLYWDNAWVSLGKQTATDIKITYENAPVGALFWIRNHSHGRDERIFTYENGKQIWW
jgi:hypothetical protein